MKLYVVVVFVISVHEVPPFIEVCHFTTVPVCPLNVIVPVFVVEHVGIVVVVAVVPPTEGVKQGHDKGEPGNAIFKEYASTHEPPLFTTTRYC